METLQNKTKLEWALYYSRLGYSVIPVSTKTRKNKTPLKNWKDFQINKPTESEIIEWWTKYPNANIALVTGKHTGLMVVDFDKGRTIKDLEEFGNFPPTACAKTGSGGQHLFFKYPPNSNIRNSAGVVFGEGIDIRAEGGIILVAPSKFEDSDVYEWIISLEDGVADVPEWLEQKLKTEKTFAGENKLWKNGLNGVSEGMRNSTATSIAGLCLTKLPRDFKNLTLDILHTWNKKNNPPLANDELFRIFESVNKYENTTKEKEYKTVSLGELLDEPDEQINWVVDNFLPIGGLSVMVAKPKVGKSTLARQLALNVANGDNFLEFKTTKGCVIYISLEEKRGEVRNHFRYMGAKGDENLHVYTGSIIENAEAWLEKEIQTKSPILVIIDTLFKFTQTDDINDYIKILRILEPLLELARGYNTHIMVLHHARKISGDGADITLGSTAIFGSVDTAVVLKRNDKNRTIETIQRYGTDIEPTILTFNSESKIIGLGNTKKDDDIKDVESKILELLQNMDEPITEKNIEDEIECNIGLIHKGLRNLVSNGLVLREGKGKKGDPYLYSCLLVSNI